MNKLFIVRGVPGAGKTTFAHSICDKVVSQDDYHTDEDGNYNWKEENIDAAFRYCLGKTRTIMETGKDVAVANTFINTNSMKRYFKLAKDLDYMVFTVVVENRHGGVSEHNVPEATITKMTERFNIRL